MTKRIYTESEIRQNLGFDPIADAAEVNHVSEFLLCLDQPVYGPHATVGSLSPCAIACYVLYLDHYAVATEQVTSGDHQPDPSILFCCEAIEQHLGIIPETDAVPCRFHDITAGFTQTYFCILREATNQLAA
jgi:hypothetical protein